MTWSYSGNPASSDKDAVRFHVGDTNPSDPLVSDEEIAFALTQEPNVDLAAAYICEAIAAQLSRSVNRRVGDVSVNGSDLAKAYQNKANDLRSRANASALPSFGGRSISEKRNLDRDTNAVQPKFKIGQDDHPEISEDDDHYPDWVK